MKPYETDTYKEHVKRGFCGSLSKALSRCRFKAKHTGVHLPVPGADEATWVTMDEWPRDKEFPDTPAGLNFVLAKNTQDFRYYRSLYKKLIPQDALYLMSPSQIKNVKDPIVYAVGCYQEHVYYDEFMEVFKKVKPEMRYM